MTFDDETIYLLDSYGLIYRCYFAFIRNPILNKQGQNVSAVFGFFRNLALFFKHYSPKIMVAALDSKSKTFRHEMYAEYKATRNKTPEDLFPQIDTIEEILKILGIPSIRCEGFEADDVIATITQKCKSQNIPCRILSGDKDLMQLVSDSTQILKPSKDTNVGSGWEVITEEGVQAEWGVTPQKLLDLLSLMGDSADNVPGCPGIGIKTGLKLIQEYGDIDGIFAHSDEIKGSTGEKIRNGKDSTELSRTLITLNKEAPLCTDFENIKNNTIPFDFASTARFFGEKGFPSIAKMFYELAKVENPITDNNEQNHDSPSTEKIDFSKEDDTELVVIKKNVGNYKGITTKQGLSDFIDEFLRSDEKIIAYDSETNGLDTITSNILGFSLCYKKGEGIYVPLSFGDSLFATEGLSTEEAFSELSRLFENPEVKLIFHNAKFDIKVLVSNGYNFITKYKCSIIDTMIAAWLLNPESLNRSSFSLEKLSEQKLALAGIEFDDIVEKNQTFADVPLEKAVPYAAEDADFTFQLWQKLSVELEQKKLTELFYNIEMKLIPILASMETEGIHLKSDELLSYDKELTENLQEIEQKIYATVGHEFNIASTKQLQEVLFTELKLPPEKKTKTGYSTDTSVLENLSYINPVPKMILEYREMAKLQSTYVQTLPKMTDKNERIHTDFIQTGTATGRLSCREPNLQNIPVRNESGRRIRAAFTAEKGKVLISADYSQIELVVLANLSKDKNMSEAFLNGIDVHKATASLIFGVKTEDVTPEMRRTAKTINFGVIYGMSAFRLAKDLEISRTQASQFINSYFETYKSIKDFMNGIIKNAEDTGYVQTIMGRTRKIMYINTKNKTERAAAERIAINTPIQGSAADIVKKAMIDVYDELEKTNSKAKLLLQVHDELILECPDDEAEIERTILLLKNKMENAVSLEVPLKVSIEYGKNWGEFH